MISRYQSSDFHSHLLLPFAASDMESYSLQIYKAAIADSLQPSIAIQETQRECIKQEAKREQLV